MRIIIVGAGHHAQVIADVLMNNLRIDVIGFTDSDASIHGNRICGCTVLGDDSVVKKLWKQNKIDGAIIGIGNTYMGSRKRVFGDTQALGVEFINVIHPSSIISKTASIGSGVVILPGAIVNSFAKIEDNVVINSNAVIEHHNIIGKNVYISSGVILSGNVVVEEDAFLGSGAVVLPNVTVGKGAIVGAGSVVLEDVKGKSKVAGVPAKYI